jgi:streptogramin lyase
MRALVSTLAAGILALCCAPAALADAVPEYFNLPPATNATSGLATAPDGTVWFGADPANRRAAIGRLTPSQAAVGTANGMALFPTPVPGGTGCCVNLVRGLAFDGANNRLWFVQSDAIVGFADAARVVPDTSAGMADRLLITPLSGGGTGQTFHGGLQDVAVGAGGLAWFTETNGSNYPPFPGHRIASIDANLGVTESDNLALQGGLVALDPLRYEARPAGITTDANGKPWFAESDAGNPGWRIGTSRGLGYDEYLATPCALPQPCSGSNTGTGLTDVAVAHDGSIWFTNQLRNEIGRLDPLARTFTNYSLTAIDARLVGGLPRAISVAQDGTLWVVENGGFSLANANAIVKIVPSQPDPTASVFHLGAGKYPLAVAPDTKGNVWFTVTTDVAPGLVGRLAGVVGAVPGGGGTGGTGGGGRVVRATSVGAARIGTPSVTPDGRSIHANQICVGPPRDICSLVYLISTHEYVAGFPGSRSARASAARKHRRAAKPKPVILGRKNVTLHGGQRKLLTISLNATGRRLLARARGGKLTVYFTATQAGARGKPARRVKQAKVTFTRPARHPARHRR